MCEYCEKRKHLEDLENASIYCYIDKNILGMQGNCHNFFRREIPISYCPMCGKKLESGK